MGIGPLGNYRSCKILTFYIRLYLYHGQIWWNMNAKTVCDGNQYLNYSILDCLRVNPKPYICTVRIW